MTIVHRDGQRIHMRDADGLAQHWRNIHLAFPGRDTVTRKRLAMFCLRENGWTNEQIAEAFGTARGHVCRCIADIARLLHDLAEPPPKAA